MAHRRAVLVIAALLAARSALAAAGAPTTTWTGSAPSGACVGSRTAVGATSGLIYCCVASVWTACGSSVTPGGSSGQVQFNDGGAFGGDAGLAYDKATDNLTVGGRVAAGSYLQAGAGGGALKLYPGTADHVYAEWYADTDNPTTRSAYMGFPSAGSTTLTIDNSIGTGVSFLDAVTAPSFSGALSGNASTASALSADPSDCASANEWAKGIVASGAATCAQVGFSNLSGTAGVTQGGTGQTSWGDNEMLVGTGVNTVARISLPAVACSASTSKMLWDPAGNGTWSCGLDTGSPAGASGVLQTNNGAGGMGACGGTSCSASNWVSGLSNVGAATCTQPAFSNLSGAATAAQLPDATGAAKGAIVLAGALGGTAASPSVVDNSHAHTTSTISGLDASNDFTAGSLPVARGGTAQTTWAADQVLIGTAAGTVARKSIDDCKATNSKLLYDTTAHAFTCGVDNTSDPTPTAWNTASLNAGFTNYGTPFSTTRYKITPDGIVFVELAVNRTSGNTIFNLPAGYRPSGTLYFHGWYTNPTGTSLLQISVTSGGDVSFTGSTTSMRAAFSFVANAGLTVSVTNGSVYGYCLNASGACVATTNSTTCSASTGSSPYTYAWSYVSGSTATVTSPTSASTTFSRNASGVVRSGVYRCTVTDSNGDTGTADVVVVTEHENSL